MRWGVLSIGLLVWAGVSASLAGVWQFPLNQTWSIDPEFQFGSPYGGEVHLGEDVEAPAGTTVQVAANGTVKLIANFPGYHDWGGLVLVEHTNVTGQRMVTLYGHIDVRTVRVKPGQIVNRGDVLGRVGDSQHNGHWKTHLHFGIRSGAYQSSPWVYWGFANQATLARWEPAHEYVPARSAMIDVARIPSASRNRYETAAAVSNWLFPADASVQQAIVVSGEHFADALSATVLAHERSIPVLLARAGGVPDETLHELERVLADGGAVHLVGGEAALGPTVETQLRAHGWTVDRIAGPDAPATAVAVAEQLAQSPKTVFIVNSGAFADGLSAGAPATVQHAPILLTDSDELSDDTSDYLQRYGSVDSIIIVGGASVVSQAVEDQLKALPQQPTVRRIAGTDRYATNRFVNEQFFNAPEQLVLATGEKFADALVGSLLAARSNGSLILASHTSLMAQVRDYIATVRPSVHVGLVLGGPAALAQSVDLQLGGLLNAGFAGALVQSVRAFAMQPLPPIDWSSATRTTRDGMTLTIPAGFQLTESHINGYRTFSVVSDDTQAEPEILLATRVDSTTSTEPQSAIARWLGVSRSSITKDAVHLGRFSITTGFMPRLVQAIPAVDNDGASMVLLSVPQSEHAQSLLDRLAELNRD